MMEHSKYFVFPMHMLGEVSPFITAEASQAVLSSSRAQKQYPLIFARAM
jgi:hypothetical protein